MAETVEVFKHGEQVPPAVPVPAGRRRLAGRIAATLSAPDGAGALVVGGPGTGKTCLAREALARMGPAVHSERVRGSALVSAIPYGALHYLLSDVDGRLLEHPLHVVAAAGRLLRERAGGRKTVVLADNAQLLDDQAAVTLAQLAADGTISLLLCAEDISQIPASFVGLWRNGLLHRFDAADFTFAETADWVAAALGAPACGQAVHELRAASGEIRCCWACWPENGYSPAGSPCRTAGGSWPRSGPGRGTAWTATCPARCRAWLPDSGPWRRSWPCWAACRWACCALPAVMKTSMKISTNCTAAAS
ncbi:ATP-binding protein [Arthrobacter mobilis]|uniref:ATP-binding protein n=1 Tax=Arthrobacter mobilis TaxID=2724944 RepID=A0A7X6HBI8_9MICC|nr:ATP-binding protein [Arthrobacter mobilis]NKX53324.1 ATP-binding protein [Arthrobacter mobilis]